jgi:hypothetical protein
MAARSTAPTCADAASYWSSALIKVWFLAASAASLLLSAGDLLPAEEPWPPLVALLADLGVADPGVVLEGGTEPPQLPAVLCTECTRVRLPAVCAVLAVPGVHRPAG